MRLFHVHRVIHGALRDAVRWDRVVENVADYADPPRQPTGELATWGVDDLRTFVEAAAEDDLGLRRMVTVSGETVAALKSQRAKQAEARLALGRSYRDEGWVFTAPTGEPLNPTTVSRSFVRLVERLGLPRLTVHGLRHTWATLALGSGIPAKVASEVLGHSSVSVTLDVYSHALPGMQEAETQLVADRIFGAGR